MNFDKPKAAAKLELLFNKLSSASESKSNPSNTLKLG
jgi:hypothetical protein